MGEEFVTDANFKKRILCVSSILLLGFLLSLIFYENGKVLILITAIIAVLAYELIPKICPKCGEKLIYYNDPYEKHILGVRNYRCKNNHLYKQEFNLFFNS